VGKPKLDEHMAESESAPKLELPATHTLVTPASKANVAVKFGQVSVFVLVHWQIRSNCEDEFLAYWRTQAIVHDRTSLVGEFLNKVDLHHLEDFPWVTWAISVDSEISALHYVNIGMWASKQAFLQQISPDFGDEAPIRPFELRRRRRMLLMPQAWRIGIATVPLCDSLGVQ